MDFVDEYPEGRRPDPVELEAVDALRAYFGANPERVFSQRQVEVDFEGRYFHWITQRALKVLAEEGEIVLEKRTLSHGAPINFVWHRSNRYTRRQVKEILGLVEQYSHPDFTAALGNTGELLVGDGFARFGFVQKGRNTREFGDRKWIESAHDLDFLFERDGRVRVIPVFVVRAMPRIWVVEVARRGGFTLVLRHQLYPLSHRGLALEVRSTLGLPVDAPRALYDGTMQRFVHWHDARRRIGRGGDPAGA